MRITYIGDASGVCPPNTEMGGVKFRLNFPVVIPKEREPLFSKLATNPYFHVDKETEPLDLPEPPPAVDPTAYAAAVEAGAIPTPEVFQVPRVRVPTPGASAPAPAAKATAPQGTQSAPRPAAAARPAAPGLPGGVPIPPSQVKE